MLMMILVLVHLFHLFLRFASSSFYFLIRTRMLLFLCCSFLKCLNCFSCVSFYAMQDGPNGKQVIFCSSLSLSLSLSLSHLILTPILILILSHHLLIVIYAQVELCRFQTKISRLLSVTFPSFVLVLTLVQPVI